MIKFRQDVSDLTFRDLEVCEACTIAGHIGIVIKTDGGEPGDWPFVNAVAISCTDMGPRFIDPDTVITRIELTGIHYKIA